MIKIKNKVVFLRTSSGGVDNRIQQSINMQGRLKKKVKRVQKLKIAEDIKVELSGNYTDVKIKIEPADTKHANMITAMLRVKL